MDYESEGKRKFRMCPPMFLGGGNQVNVNDYWREREFERKIKMIRSLLMK